MENIVRKYLKSDLSCLQNKKQKLSSTRKVRGIRLQAIIGKRTGKLTEEDTYEIEGIFQNYTLGLSPGR